jgi:hypothetical protein
MVEVVDVEIIQPGEGAVVNVGVGADGCYGEATRR